MAVRFRKSELTQARTVAQLHFIEDDVQPTWKFFIGISCDMLLRWPEIFTQVKQDAEFYIARERARDEKV
jgi:hypothetical protein